jgi:hypothetical protein
MEIKKGIWLNMKRNPKAIENPKQPYFKLSLPPQEEGGEWQEIGVAWKSKTTEGSYGFKFADNVQVIITPKITEKDLPPIAD